MILHVGVSVPPEVSLYPRSDSSGKSPVRAPGSLGSKAPSRGEPPGLEGWLPCPAQERPLGPEQCAQRNLPDRPSVSSEQSKPGGISGIFHRPAPAVNWELRPLFIVPRLRRQSVAFQVPVTVPGTRPPPWQPAPRGSPTRTRTPAGRSQSSPAGGNH